MSNRFAYAVRWIQTGFSGGEYHNCDLDKSLNWELNLCTRQRSFAITTPRCADFARYGLLLDWHKCEVDAIYRGDVYTVPDCISRNYDNTVSPQNYRSFRMSARKKEYCNTLAIRLYTHHQIGSYHECIGDKLVFCGGLCSRIASKRERNYFAGLCRKYGIPYLGVIGEFKATKYFSL